MNVLFDLVASQPGKNLKYHGGSEYAKAVFMAVSQIATGRLYCLHDAGRDLDTDINSYCQTGNITLIDINKFKKLDQIIEKYNIGLFYSALPLEKSIQQMLPLKVKIKSIITIHGLRSLELLSDTYEPKYSTGIYSRLKYFYKRFFPFRYESGLLLSIRELINNYYDPEIITVSGYSKESIKYFLPEIPADKIHELYSPILDYLNKRSDDSILLTSKLDPKKFFLLISAGIWQKNSYRMLKASDSLIKKGLTKGYKFVVIGAPDKIRRAFPNRDFVYLDYVERMDLESLLKNAFALLYPSLNEGFGYPPLEAFKYGTGVIASAIAPVMEVCGNAALFFNPYSIMEMKLMMLQSIDDPDFTSNTQVRIDQYLSVRLRQKRDLEALVKLICSEK
jgi:hypothetical protein